MMNDCKAAMLLQSPPQDVVIPAAIRSGRRRLASALHKSSHSTAIWEVGFFMNRINRLFLLFFGLLFGGFVVVFASFAVFGFPRVESGPPGVAYWFLTAALIALLAVPWITHRGSGR